MSEHPDNSKMNERPAQPGPSVFMMDLWATVPYYTAYLSRALIAQGARVQVGSITYYLDPDCFTTRGLKTEPGLLDIIGRFPRLPRLLRRALKLVEGLLNLTALSVRFALRPPDIAHVQFLPMLRAPLPVDLWFVRLCRWRGAKIVLTVHDLLPHDTAESFKRVYTCLYAEMDALICHSDHIKARLEAEFTINRSKISVIPHGPFFFDCRRHDEMAISSAYKTATDGKLVLWQGIILPYKGVDVLLDAWSKVEQVVPEAKLIIAGTGAATLLEQLKKKVECLQLKRVKMDFRFISTAELVAAYRTADVVVYPYRAITTSGALATGLALGSAIVATDLPVFQELLQDRENALLVAPGDPAALSDAIITLLQNAELRSHLRTAVRALNFGERSWHNIARKTGQLYKALALSGPEQLSLSTEDAPAAADQAARRGISREL